MAMREVHGGGCREAEIGAMAALDLDDLDLRPGAIRYVRTPLPSAFWRYVGPAPAPLTPIERGRRRLADGLRALAERVDV